MKKALFLLCLTLSWGSVAQDFIVEDIRIEGLQRVSPGSVFAALPARVGDPVDSLTIRDTIEALFRTGFFADIDIERDGDVLVVRVDERPVISEVTIEGNDVIPTENLMDNMRDNGLAEGQIFRPATLDGISRALEREYVAQGHYGASIDPQIRELPRNRIGIDIVVTEGEKSAIKSINIVGNEIFSDEELLDVFELKTTNLFSFFRNDDKYARERLAGDLERLESYYLDRGYLRFSIDSSQVSVSEDKRQVFITINVTEGTTYRIANIDLLGEMVIPEVILSRLILPQEGQIYTQSLITSTIDLMTNQLANLGYTFAEVEDIPEINEEERTVDLSFFVDPGARVYVRRVEFRGNTRTDDEVLRREMRQMESAIASNQNIETGEVRLNRLGFFGEIESETTPVPGTNDQIDVLYTVQEQPSGQIEASLGYAEYSGLLLGLSLQERNFLGTGTNVGFSINRSTYQESYQISYSDPYFTPDGVSAGFSVFSTKTDYGELNIATFTNDATGINLNFGYPTSEVSRINFGLGYENLSISTGAFASPEILELTSNGGRFDSFKFQAGWTYATINRLVLPDRGNSLQFRMETSIPGSDLSFYKLEALAETYIPMPFSTTFKIKGRLAYGESYGETDRLPFFENYYGGGFGSVRGFKTNELGPRASNPDNLLISPNPIGGNMLAITNLELILPTPFLPDASQVQAVAFVDIGNVFDTKCAPTQANCYAPTFKELRYSTGLGVTWITGIAPISFSIGKAYNASDLEELEFFQFTLGGNF